MTTNGNGFIYVIIQYHLGAFGFLSGKDIEAEGVLDAGLLDINFALQWVQKHIKSFGGDPAHVTIAGESAGSAAVRYQAIAYGEKQNVALFQNVGLQRQIVDFVDGQQASFANSQTDSCREPVGPRAIRLRQ